MPVAERLSEVQEQIRAHAGDRQVTLVAVTKYATVAQMREAYDAGLRDFGENKVQDALAKMEAFPQESYPDLRWHFIGPLQSNKAKKTVGRFALIHALDSLSLAETLARLNADAGRKQAVLVQINASGDPARHGVLPNQINPLVEDLLKLNAIELRGLMVMAPAEASLKADSAELTRVFCGLRDMRDRLERECGIVLPELSMGMSHDFPHALACGATIIRIGNYLFKN